MSRLAVLSPARAICHNADLSPDLPSGFGDAFPRFHSRMSHEVRCGQTVSTKQVSGQWTVWIPHRDR